MKKVFFHIHLWKTAGTTFLNICSDNFKKDFHRDTMLIQNWFLTKDQLRWILGYHDWIRCYSCHMLNGDLPFETVDREVIGIAFVRDPVNRYVSSFNFQRGASYRGGIAKEENFDDFIQKTLVDTVDPMWRDGQTFVIGGSADDSGLSVIEECIKANKIILLPTERFDESCILLEKLFPDDFVDCSYTPKNVSRKSEPITEPQRAKIARYMQNDYRLVQKANDFLDKTLERLIPDEMERGQQIQDFRRRCEKKKKRSRLEYLTRHPVGAVKSLLFKLSGSNE